MPTIRIGTFNCENLFARFKFNKDVDPEKATKEGFDINMTNFDILREPEKRLTAQAIAALNADVITLQEVENLDVLKRFRNDRLRNKKYTFAMVVDGNDPRKIDLAVLSRFPLVATRSHQHLKDGSSFIFSRDCLEVDVDVSGKRLTLFVNHFKSMMGGRKKTRARRVKQAAEVKKIVQARFGSSPGSAPWAVLGDLNDFEGTAQGTTSGITSLVKWSEVENVLNRLPDAERFTHFFEGAPASEPKVRQLDYILLSSSLAGATAALPKVVRGGLSPKATEATEPRFAGVTAKTVASDHCPLGIEINL